MTRRSYGVMLAGALVASLGATTGLAQESGGGFWQELRRGITGEVERSTARVTGEGKEEIFLVRGTRSPEYCTKFTNAAGVSKYVPEIAVRGRISYASGKPQLIEDGVTQSGRTVTVSPLHYVGTTPCDKAAAEGRLVAVTANPGAGGYYDASTNPNKVMLSDHIDDEFCQVLRVQKTREIVEIRLDTTNAYGAGVIRRGDEAAHARLQAHCERKYLGRIGDRTGRPGPGEPGYSYAYKNTKLIEELKLPQLLDRAP